MGYLLNPYMIKSSIFPTYGAGTSNNTKNAYTNNLYVADGTVSTTKFTGGTNTAMAGNYYNNISATVSRTLTTANNAYGFKYVYSGTQNYSFSTTSNNYGWIRVYFRAGGGTTGVDIGNFKINVSGTYYTVDQAISNGYIEPLVLTNSSAWSTSYYWVNAHLALTTTVGNANYPQLLIWFKPKVAISAIQMYSNVGFNTTYDGMMAEQYDGLNVSLTPFDF